MEALEILRKMREQLDKGWTKGSLFRSLPTMIPGQDHPLILQVCLQGACVAAIDTWAFWGTLEQLSDILTRTLPVAEAMVTVIAEQFPERILAGEGSAWTKVVWFNDDENTTIEDIQMVLGKAILALEG